jgi:hypothetical protein
MKQKLQEPLQRPLLLEDLQANVAPESTVAYRIKLIVYAKEMASKVAPCLIAVQLLRQNCLLIFPAQPLEIRLTTDALMVATPVIEGEQMKLGMQ